MTKTIDWEKVIEAVTWLKGNPLWAETLLLSAIGESNGEPDDEVVTGGDVVYGKDSYTDNFDPRNPNNSRQHIDGRSIHLTVHRNGNNLYKAKSVESIFNVAGNGGRTVARVQVPNGFSGYVVLAYPYTGGTNFEKEIVHSVGQDIIITNKFSPTIVNGKEVYPLGPLAIYLKNSAGVRVSDIVANIGLPKGEHVSFNIVFG